MIMWYLERSHQWVYDRKMCEIDTFLLKNSPHHYIYNTIDLHFSLR